MNSTLPPPSDADSGPVSDATFVPPPSAVVAAPFDQLLDSVPPEVKMISWSNSAPIRACSDWRAPRMARPTSSPKAWIEDALPNCSVKKGSMQRRRSVLLQAFLDFVTGFVDMAVNRQVELCRQRQNSLEACIGNRVGRMRGEAKADQWVASPFLACGQALVEVVGCVAGVRRWKFQGSDADHGTHAEFRSRCSGRLGKKIHVVEAGDATQQHFGTCEPRSIVYVLR